MHGQVVVLVQVNGGVEDRCPVISGTENTIGNDHMKMYMAAGEMTAVLVGEFNQYGPRLSPDGRWLAYVSAESGTPEIYLRDWPELSRRWPVSQQGGIRPPRERHRR